MHQTLYRKYRPRAFDGEGGVVGQEHVTSVLQYETAHDRLSHAYLFCGPRGTGKTSCAKILAKAINCEHPVNGNPCGTCYACTSIDAGAAPDVTEMDAASNNGVDTIRDLREEISFTPAALKKRVYIVDEVHMLSTSAFNALLKTLEEPPEHVVFILATTEMHKLPATIISRCQRFEFRRIRFDVIAERLLWIGEKENIRIEKEAAQTIAKQAQGCMRDAISLFELTASGGFDVTVDRVSDVLGLAGIQTQYKTAVAVSKNDASALFSIVASVDSSAKDISVYWTELLGFWRDMLVAKNLPEAERVQYLDYTEPEMRLLLDGARRFRPEALTRHFALMDEALREMTRLPQSKRLTAELTLIRMADAALDTSTAALLSRIGALEDRIALLESGMTVIPSPLPPAAAGDGSEISRPAQAEDAGTAQTVDPAPQKPEDADPGKPADLSDVIERCRSQIPGCAGHLMECDCFVSEDGRQITVKAAGAFARDMLMKPENLAVLSSVFRLCGIGAAGASVTVTTGAKPKVKEALDELAEY
ncbi:MAG: DNA polymerase III subunit gamma/tau [Ruminococcaceae bacterium]|jgi:DNA polymerase-3 subunit gamma/tau|nr:DNA polymerase III subunit gamma/tau [Oscillospiraceae bacterium]